MSGAVLEREGAQERAWQYHEVSGHPGIGDAVESPAERRFRRWRRAKSWAARTKRNDCGFAENPHGAVKPGDYDYVNPPRECMCGKAKFGSATVSVVDDGEGGHYSDISRCGAVWTCPVCSGIIRRKRAEEIDGAIRRHLEAGGGLLLVTETIQHNAGHKLASLIDILKASHKGVTAARAYKNIRRDYGLVGYITSLEITRGEANGWHPHQHLLIFTQEPMDDAAARGVRRELYPVWSRYVERNGGTSGWEHGLDVQAVRSAEAAGRYLAKVAQEMSNIGDMKRGSGSVTPFQLLDEPTRKNELLFREYAKATKGKSAIRWSRGLREKLGLGRAMTDEQLANEPKPGVEMARIARDLWSVVSNDKAMQDAVKDAVLRGDEQAAADILGCVVDYQLVIDGEGRPGFVPMFVRRKAEYDHR